LILLGNCADNAKEEEEEEEDEDDEDDDDVEDEDDEEDVEEKEDEEVDKDEEEEEEEEEDDNVGGGDGITCCFVTTASFPFNFLITCPADVTEVEVVGATFGVVGTTFAGEVEAGLLRVDATFAGDEIVAGNEFGAETTFEIVADNEFGVGVTFASDVEATFAGGADVEITFTGFVGVPTLAAGTVAPFAAGGTVAPFGAGTVAPAGGLITFFFGIARLGAGCT
jgi:hypothetical protein